MLFSNPTSLNKKPASEIMQEASGNFQSLIQWINLAKGSYSDTGYYALFNGIYIIDTLLKTELKPELSNKTANDHLRVLTEQTLNQINDLAYSHYPYGAWRQHILQLRNKTDFTDLGSWLSDSELISLIEKERSTGLLKHLDVSILLVEYSDLDAVISQKNTNNRIILVNDCGYWMTLVSYKPKSVVENFWLGAWAV